MRNQLRIGMAALAAVLLSSACDSFPGMVDVVRPQEGNAVLTVRNAGSRTITLISLDPCSGDSEAVRSRYKVQVGPDQEWSRGFPAACHHVSFDFNTGGGWTGTAYLTEAAPTLIQPW